MGSHYLLTTITLISFVALSYTFTTNEPTTGESGDYSTTEDPYLLKSSNFWASVSGSSEGSSYSDNYVTESSTGFSDVSDFSSSTYYADSTDGSTDSSFTDISSTYADEDDEASSTVTESTTDSDPEGPITESDSVTSSNVTTTETSADEDAEASSTVTESTTDSDPEGPITESDSVTSSNVTTTETSENADDPTTPAESSTYSDDLSDATTPDEFNDPIAWSSPLLYQYHNGENLLEGFNGYTFTGSDSELIDAISGCSVREIGGQVGVPFFGNRLRSISICDNGLLLANSDAFQRYPSSFGTSSFFNNIPLIAPLWSQSNPFAMEVLASITGIAGYKPRVYFQMYKSSSTDDETAKVMVRAAADAATAGAPEGFQASTVTVVTWLNMVADQDGCYWLAQDHLLTILLPELASLFGWDTNAIMTELTACALQAENMPLNHVQAVLISDGTYSFLKYIYPEEGVSWVNPNVLDYSGELYDAIFEQTGGILFGTSTGGFWSGDKVSDADTGSAFNLANSGSLAFINIDNTEGNTGAVGEWVWCVDQSDGTLSPQQVCLAWVEAQEADQTVAMAVTAVNDMYPCPDSWIKAIFSTQFEITSFDSHLGRSCFESAPEINNYHQTCCYTTFWGNLILTPPLAGYITNSADSEEDTAYSACCIEAPELCREFYKIRPVVRLSITKLFRRVAKGDPHITTLDGIDYTFNGLGEYVYLGTDDESGQIQARTARILDSDAELGQATYFSAVAIQSGSLPAVHIEVVNTTDSAVTSQLQMFYDGSAVNFSSLVQGNNSQTLDSINSAYRFGITNVSVIVVTRSTGLLLNVSSSLGFLNLGVTVPSSFQDNTKGLLGLMDGNTTNDFTSVDGTSYISSDSTPSELFAWCTTWAVNDTTSIMYYPNGKSNADFADLTYVPFFAEGLDSFNWTDEAFKNESLALCGDNLECLTDVYLTGSLAVGENTKAVGEEAAAISSQLENSPPVVEGPETVSLTTGTEIMLTLNISDADGDVLSLNITPSEATVNVTSTQAIITYTLRAQASYDNFQLQVILTDAKGASAVWTPMTFICGCVNDATCRDFTQTQLSESVSSTMVKSCQCTTGYTGSLCETDIDACAAVAEPCYLGVVCTDLMAPSNSYTCGSCPSGYAGDGRSCSDINECLNTTECTQNCVNVPGAYSCSCNSGYELTADGFTCDDINECLLNPCHQTCNNTAGSYECGCEVDWMLSADNINCEPANPCDANNQCDSREGIGYCSKDAATNTTQCLCGRGYQLMSDGVTCEDIDECISNTTNICEGMCENNNGSFTCSCGTGYTLDSNAASCVDVNECALGAYTCNNTGEVCSNTAGSYVCVCPSGATLSNGVCVVPSATDPVIIDTSTPSAEVEYNSVSIIMSGITISEYTRTKETQLFTVLAEQATTYCQTATSGCSTSTAAVARRKRATITYSSNDVSRVPGYPQTTDASNLDVKVYITNSDGSGYVPSTQLSSIVSESQSQIESSLNVTVESIAAAATTTTGLSTNSQTTAAVTAKPVNLTGVYIGVGVAGGLLVIAAAVVVAILIIKKKQSNKIRQSDSLDAHRAESQQTHVTQTQPPGQANPAWETSPAHQSQPSAQASPAHQPLASPAHQTSPARQGSPAARASPAPLASPDAQASPARQASPVQMTIAPADERPQTGVRINAASPIGSRPSSSRSTQITEHK